ncbi:hypothetical protein LDENG_00245270 [Lucifuga dentata]|nr:hypothetical protein LDENG_00245270 [Lucifuga dentata]
MMAASMWRMNGLWRGMALVLVLCALLLNNGVMCQEDDTTTATDPGTADADPGASPAPTDNDATTGSENGDTASSPAASLDVTILTAIPNIDSQGGEDTSGTSGTPAAPNAGAVTDLAAEGSKSEAPVLVVPEVKCVGKEDIDKNYAVKAMVNTNDCEATKKVLQENPASWCNLDKCNLEVFQQDSAVLMASPDAKPSTLAGALQSVKEKLGVTDVETPSSGSSVFVVVLLTGLLLAAALIGGYCLKFRRGSDAKGMRLAEEAYPVDQENQGNTLVSVAPLNPPPETQEKPSVNGESPEAAKTEPPPTNGSTAKTADTEL